MLCSSRVTSNITVEVLFLSKFLRDWKNSGKNITALQCAQTPQNGCETVEGKELSFFISPCCGKYVYFKRVFSGQVSMQMSPAMQKYG